MSKQEYVSEMYGQQNISEISRYNQKFTRFSNARQKWAKRFKEYEQLVNNDIEDTGTQLTEKQLKDIEKKYGIPISANILVAILEQIQAFLTSNDGTVTVVPVGESSKIFSYVWKELCLATLQINKFKREKKKAIRDMLIGGLGVFQVEPNTYYTYNEFNTIIKRLRWEWMYLDDTSEIETFQDSEMIFVAKPIPKQKAQKVYKLSKEDVEFASTAFGSMDGNFSPMLKSSGTGALKEDAKIWVMEIYEKIPATIYILKDGTRTCTKPPYINENGQLVETHIGSYPALVVKKCIKVGNLIRHQEIMPITQYPFGFYVHTYADSPNVYGIVHHIADVCYAINKALALIIENAQKGANSGTISPIGAVVDKEKWEIARATPGGNAEYVADPSMPNNGAPTPVQPAPANNAWFTIYKDLIKLVEYISGIFDLMQGNGENAPQTLGATTQLQNFGTQRVKMVARSLDDTDESLLDLVIEFIQAYAPKGNITHYLNDTDGINEIRTDVEGALMQGEQGQRFTPQQGGQQSATMIKVQKGVEEEIMYIVGQLKLGQYKVRYNSASNLPTTRTAALQAISSVMAHIQDPALTMALLEQVLTLMDVPQVDTALRKANQAVQMQQKIQEFAAQNEKLIKDNEDLQKKLKDSLFREEVAEIHEKAAVAEAVVNQEIKHLQGDIKEYKSEKKRKEAVKDYD